MTDRTLTDALEDAKSLLGFTPEMLAGFAEKGSLPARLALALVRDDQSRSETERDQADRWLKFLARRDAERATEKQAQRSGTLH